MLTIAFGCRAGLATEVGEGLCSCGHLVHIAQTIWECWSRSRLPLLGFRATRRGRRIGRLVGCSHPGRDGGGQLILEVTTDALDGSAM